MQWCFSHSLIKLHKQTDKTDTRWSMCYAEVQPEDLKRYSIRTEAGSKGLMPQSPFTQIYLRTQLMSFCVHNSSNLVILAAFYLPTSESASSPFPLVTRHLINSRDAHSNRLVWCCKYISSLCKHHVGIVVFLSQKRKLHYLYRKNWNKLMTQVSPCN